MHRINPSRAAVLIDHYLTVRRNKPERVQRLIERKIRAWRYWTNG